MSNELHNDSESEAFLAEVCWHYFINEMTQSEVARLLGITRLRVNQAIKTARETGLVRVEIQSFHTTRLSLQQRLKNRLDLAEVIVAPANREAHDYHQPVGAALAALLANGLREGQWKSIGVSWGMTLKNTITRLPRLSLPEVEIVSMIGGTSTHLVLLPALPTVWGQNMRYSLPPFIFHQVRIVQFFFLMPFFNAISKS